MFDPSHGSAPDVVAPLRSGTITTGQDAARTDGRGTALVFALVLLAACGEADSRSAGDFPHVASELPIDLAPGTRSMALRLRQVTEETDPFDNPYFNTQRVAIWEQRVEDEGGHGQAPMTTRLSLARELLFVGQPGAALELFEEGAARIAGLGDASNPEMRKELRRMQILAWLRLGEQQNCLEHHDVDSCIVPIRAGGVHTRAEGAQRAHELCLEALREDEGDWEARWLLNLTAMTLGTWPGSVPEPWRIGPEAFASDYDIGRFLDGAREAGVNHIGLAGGVCMEDFDGDGRLDLLISRWGVNDALTMLRNDGDGTFSDRTEAMELPGITGGLNMVHADADNDGDADVFVLRGGWFEEAGKYPSSLLRNEGGLRFTDATERAGLLSCHPTQTGAWGDYDGDGWLDLFVGNETGARQPHPCALFHNEGGTFTDVAAPLGLALTGYIKGVVFGDIENDGDLDLYVSRTDGQNWLLRNDGPRRARRAGSEEAANGQAPGADDAGRSDDAASAPPAGQAGGDDASEAGQAGGDDAASIPGQLGGDSGAPTRREAAAFRRWTFTDISAAAGVQEPERSFPTFFFDYDNDGWLDLFVSGYRFGSAPYVARDYLGLPNKGIRAKLYRNRHDGTFEDVSEAAGVSKVVPSMGCNFGDLDNDGWLDFYCGTGEPDLAAVYPNRMFRNDGAGRFQDVTTSGGFGHVQKGHGVAFGDVDGDGDQEVYIVVGGAYEGDVFTNALFVNPGHGNRWITLRLEGREANRSAIGARVRVRIVEEQGGEPVERDVHVTVGTGGSFGSASLQQEIGLGQATAIRELVVEWPGSRRVDRVTDVPLDRVLKLAEGDGAVTVIEPEAGAGR